MAFHWKKKDKKWIIKALDRDPKRVIAWVTGNRDIETVEKLYQKIKHLKEATFYTDNWDAFSAVLPKKHHVIGKKHTLCIERNNSDTRNSLGRMVRKTKIVSKSEEIINISLKFWYHFSNNSFFKIFQDKFLSIFR